MDKSGKLSFFIRVTVLMKARSMDTSLWHVLERIVIFYETIDKCLERIRAVRLLLEG